jgi:glucose/arabinose dehydrogenase
MLDLAVNNSGDRGLKGITFSSDGTRIYLTYDASKTADDSEGDDNVGDSRLVWYNFENGAITGGENLIYSTAAFDSNVPSDLNGIGPCIVAPDGFLYMGHGDRNNRFSALDFDPGNGSGKIFRWNQDGTIPGDNPLGADNPIFSVGFRKPTSFAVNPKNGLFWVTDVGSTVSDELNLLAGGRFYGWPLIHGSTDQEFEGDVSGLLFLFNQAPIIDFGFERFEPRGLVILDGDVYGEAVDGDILMGQPNTVPTGLYRWSIDEQLVASRTLLIRFDEAAGRIRELVRGPDGRIFVFTQNELFVLNPG